MKGKQLPPPNSAYREFFGKCGIPNCMVSLNQGGQTQDCVVWEKTLNHKKYAKRSCLKWKTFFVGLPSSKT